MNIEIRQASGNEDLLAAARLLSEYTEMLTAHDPSVQDYLELQHYEDELRDLNQKYGPPWGRLCLAYCEGKAAGCAALRRLSAESCEMKRFYVRPAFRGNHIGRLLIESLTDSARKIGYSHMLLDTLPFLSHAIQLYRDFGFYEIPRYNDSPVEGTLFMQLDLNGSLEKPAFP